MSAQIRHQVLIVAIAHVDEIESRVKCASSSLKMANWQPNFESVIFLVVINFTRQNVHIHLYNKPCTTTSIEVDCNTVLPNR